MSKSTTSPPVCPGNEHRAFVLSSDWPKVTLHGTKVQMNGKLRFRLLVRMVAGLLKRDWTKGAECLFDGI